MYIQIEHDLWMHVLQYKRKVKFVFIIQPSPIEMTSLPLLFDTSFMSIVYPMLYIIYVCVCHGVLNYSIRLSWTVKCIIWYPRLFYLAGDAEGVWLCHGVQSSCVLETRSTKHLTASVKRQRVSMLDLSSGHPSLGDTCFKNILLTSFSNWFI